MLEDRADHFDDRAPGVFEPDTLLASQYFDRIRRRRAPDGERRLMIAVLEDAIHVYLKNCGARDAHHRALFLDAEEWIESDDSTSFYSFENVCAVLDLDADYLRRGLRGWKARTSGRAAVEGLPATDDTSEADVRRAANGD